MNEYCKKCCGYTSSQSAGDNYLASLTFPRDPNREHKLLEASLAMTTEYAYLCTVDFGGDETRATNHGTEGHFDNLNEDVDSKESKPIGACVFLKAIRNQAKKVQHIVVMLECFQRVEDIKRLIDFNARLFHCIPQEIVTFE
jgi:hypothetical protein